jgi:hypothetical protein
MEWRSSSAAWIGAIALGVMAFGGAVNADAAVKAKKTNGFTGAAYDPTTGYGNVGNGTAAMGNSGASYNFYPQYPGLTGYGATGGYGGGTCCNGVWDGYCAEKRKWCECRVKHRCRPLGRGAGPCCPNGCGRAACLPAAPVCHAAPCKRWLGLFHHCPKPCVRCAVGAEGVVEDAAAPVEAASPAAEPTIEPVPDEQN